MMKLPSELFPKLLVKGSAEVIDLKLHMDVYYNFIATMLIFLS